MTLGGGESDSAEHYRGALGRAGCAEPKSAMTWGRLIRTRAPRVLSVLGTEAQEQDGGSYLNEHKVPEHVDVPEISQAKERGEKATEQHSC